MDTEACWLFRWQVTPKVGAFAFFTNQEWQNALETYEQLTRLNAGRMTWGEIYTNSYYMLGEILIELGRPDEARMYFTRYLDLMEKADPDNPHVESARIRMKKIPQ